MQGNTKIIHYCNILLENELTASNQYFIHARMFKSWGLVRLNDLLYQESINEIKHADKFIKRILSLKGIPSLQDFKNFKIGKDVIEIFKIDLLLELKVVKDLHEAISYAESINDYVSRNIMVNILIEEEDHVDWLETELKLIENIGLKNYQQVQIK